MKFALGFLTCCILVVVITVVLAPECAHKVIDKLHKNSKGTTKPLLSKINSKNTNGEANKENTFGDTGKVVESSRKNDKRTTSNIQVIPGNNEDGGIITRPPTLPSNNEHDNTKAGKKFGPSAQQMELPSAEIQLLEWLKTHNYKVSQVNGHYRIAWHTKKPLPYKPFRISINENGAVVPSYTPISVTGDGGTSIVASGSGQIVYTAADRDGVTRTVYRGERFVSRTDTDGITTNGTIKNNSDSWWIEIARSFDWIPGQDNIADVQSRAKKIKDLNYED